MKFLKLFIVLTFLVLSFPNKVQDIKQNEVKQAIKQVAKWQINHFPDNYSNRKKPYHSLTGLMALFILA